MPEHPRGQSAADHERPTAPAQTRVPDAETLTAVADGLLRLPGDAYRPAVVDGVAATALFVRRGV